MPSWTNFFQTRPAGVLDEVQAHRQVVVEEQAGVGPVGADPAHPRRQVDHHAGLELAIHGRDVVLAREIEFGRLRHDEIFGRHAPRRQRRLQMPAQEAHSAGQYDSLSR